ncbi:hypothetical protein JI57_03945 [Psychromonas sp. PRT-SC03]|nr:hypothetical protein JI57_03945 [Psychromonas sp. PRT-SC03]
MALSASSLKNSIISEMKSKGFITEGEFSRAGELAEIIANAVVSEITQNAVVIVDKGSSAGNYKVS